MSNAIYALPKEFDDIVFLIFKMPCRGQRFALKGNNHPGREKNISRMLPLVWQSLFDALLAGCWLYAFLVMFEGASETSL